MGVKNMFIIHRRTKLGREDYGGIRSKFYFSYGNYLDKRKMGIGPLIAINIDQIDPLQGFGDHQHRDIEIITYVLKGALTHQDHIGNKVTLQERGVHVISSGSGLTHSEFNETDEITEAVQIWIEPKEKGNDPSYTYQNFTQEESLNQVLKITSDSSRDGILKIDQDIDIFILDLDEEHYKPFKMYGNSVLYIVQLEGESYMNGNQIYAKDAVEATEDVHIQPITHSRFLILEIHD